MPRPRLFVLPLALAAALAVIGLPSAAPVQAEEPAAVASPPYATAEAAAQALVQVLGANDDAGLVRVLGPGSETFVESGKDPVVRARRLELAAEGSEQLTLEATSEGSEATSVFVAFGAGAWPLPVPLVKGADGWRFDAKTGAEDIRTRQIGRHELDAIGFCRVYAQLQEAYFSDDRDGDGVREYAQRFHSTKGQRDGLWWEHDHDAHVGGDDGACPMCAPLAEPDAGEDAPPFAGYRWRILTGQGPTAPGGAYWYVINGHMVGGYALIAWPAEYRKTGVMTFLISRNGTLYEKDLGEDTDRYGRSTELFAPDDSWQVVESDDEATLPPGGARPLVPTEKK